MLGFLRLQQRIAVQKLQLGGLRHQLHQPLEQPLGRLVVAVEVIGGCQLTLDVSIVRRKRLCPLQFVDRLLVAALIAKQQRAKMVAFRRRWQLLQPGERVERQLVVRTYPQIVRLGVLAKAQGSDGFREAPASDVARRFLPHAVRRGQALQLLPRLSGFGRPADVIVDLGDSLQAVGAKGRELFGSDTVVLDRVVIFLFRGQLLQP